MIKKISALLFCFLLCLGLLTGCNTQKAYKDDCKIIKKAIISAAKKNEKYSTKKISRKKASNDILEIFNDAHVQTSEGKRLKKKVIKFWKNYGKKLLLKGINKNNGKEIKNSMDDISDAFDDFLDAAEDKGADIDDLKNYETKILDCI